MSTLSVGSAAVLCPVEPLNYSINDTCILLGISRPTVYRLHRQGVLNIHKFGNRSLITAEDINACQRKMMAGMLPRNIRGHHNDQVG
ncbi:MAG: helix-turn-helix domain-containing protein [Rhodospirillales bacterium]|jgi:excisionase family DNA binding protein|nr:helix-turn-helix domain-containing protein [Rhodospirillales bacterium]